MGFCVLSLLIAIVIYFSFFSDNKIYLSTIAFLSIFVPGVFVVYLILI